MATAIVTTSWDDGAPEDVRLAELLAKHGVQGTFYVPRTNCEGRPVMSDDALKDIAAAFEIGGHTRDHVYLNRIDDEAIRSEQVAGGKQALEDVLGRRIYGFCYPGGGNTEAIRKTVEDAGFVYARTTVNLTSDPSLQDVFQVPTSLQFYPRAGYKHIKSYLRSGQFRRRSPYFVRALQPGSLPTRLKRLIDCCAERQAYFHLWGHSWEIARLDLWRDLDTVLAHMARTFPRAALVDNHGAASRARANLTDNQFRKCE
jgi:peptidoglycan/xylan/chitin deacetylase (PgdA/CDA1 family)